MNGNELFYFVGFVITFVCSVGLIWFFKKEIINWWKNLNWIVKMLVVAVISTFVGIFIGKHIVFNSDAVFWVASTIIQSLVAMIAFIGIFYIYRLRELNSLIDREYKNKSNLESDKLDKEEEIKNPKIFYPPVGIEATEEGFEEYSKKIEKIEKEKKEELKKELEEIEKEINEYKGKINNLEHKKSEIKRALLDPLQITFIAILVSFLLLPFGGGISLQTAFAQTIASYLYTSVFISLSIFLAVYAVFSVLKALSVYLQE